MKRKKARKRRNPLIIVSCLMIIGLVGAIAYFEQGAERQAMQLSQLREQLRRFEATQPERYAPPGPPPGMATVPADPSLSPNGRYRVRLGNADANGETRTLEVVPAEGGEPMTIAPLVKGFSYTRNLEDGVPVGSVRWDPERGLVAAIYAVDRKPYACTPGDCVKRLPVRELEIIPEGIEWK